MTIPGPPLTPHLTYISGSKRTQKSSARCQRVTPQLNCAPAPANGKKRLYEIYQAADASYTGPVSVPVLWDKQRGTIVSGILSIILVLVILQLWLLTATMNAYLGGESGVVVPAALASLLCLALNLGLLWYLVKLD